MKKSYSIKMTINGEEKRLGDAQDFRKRAFFDTREKAEQKAAWWRNVHPNAEIVIQEFAVEE